MSSFHQESATAGPIRATPIGRKGRSPSPRWEVISIGVRSWLTFSVNGTHLVGKGNKPATMPLTLPVLRVLEACRGNRTEGPLVLRPLSLKPIDRRDCYRMVRRIAKAAGIPRHISPYSLRHAAITNALDAGVPLRDAQILARHADPRTTEHYDRARGNLDRHGVHFLTAYVAGV